MFFDKSIGFLKQIFLKHLTSEWFPSANSARQSATQEGAFSVRLIGCAQDQKSNHIMGLFEGIVQKIRQILANWAVHVSLKL